MNGKHGQWPVRPTWAVMCSDGKLWLNGIDTLEAARAEKAEADDDCTGCNMKNPRRHVVVREDTLREDTRHAYDRERDRVRRGRVRVNSCSECGEPGHDRRKHRKDPGVTQAA